MSTVRNARVIYNALPQGYPEPGKTTVYDTTQTIDINNVPLHGGILVKVLELSVDPYLRGRMRDPSVKSYAPGFVIGDPLYSFGVGVVVRSENPDIKAGAHVYGILDHQEYVVKSDVTGLQVLQNPYNLPWSAFIGVLGMPGRTAFFAWREYSKAKKGDTVFVSTGAGPVGSFVIQLAKEEGLKVIGSAGSEEKVQFMKEIGADVAFNYKTTSTIEVLAKEGPIDVYWDNVGGETLDAALVAANTNARFIECGMIAGYNSSGGATVHNLMHLVRKTIAMNGFIVSNLAANWEEEFMNAVPPKVASGELKYREDVYHGLETVGDVILAVQKGTNKAKAVVHVADS